MKMFVSVLNTNVYYNAHIISKHRAESEAPEFMYVVNPKWVVKIIA